MVRKVRTKVRNIRTNPKKIIPYLFHTQNPTELFRYKKIVQRFRTSVNLSWKESQGGRVRASHQALAREEGKKEERRDKCTDITVRRGIEREQKRGKAREREGSEWVREKCSVKWEENKYVCGRCYLCTCSEMIQSGTTPHSSWIQCTQYTLFSLSSFLFFPLL